MSNIINLSDFRRNLRIDKFRITSATRGEVRARAAVERVNAARYLPSKEVLEVYQQAVLERNVDPIFECDDNGAA